MTISARNKVRLLFILVSFVVVVFALFSYISARVRASYLLLPQNLVELERSHSFFFSYSSQSVATSALLFSLISFAFSIYIYFAFRKIQVSEIFFLEIFLFSINWEVARLLLPLFSFSPLIMPSLSSISRILYFFRFLSLFSLLGMALFSIKTITWQSSFIIFLLFFLSLMLSMIEPMDSTSLNYFFMAGKPLIKTYLTMFLFISIFLISTTFFSYLYDSIPERLCIIGAFISLILGYASLLFSYSYLILFLGVFLFVYGLFKLVKSIHSIYLWQ